MTSAAAVGLRHLDNLWIQVSGTHCNIECTHCFNNSGPRETTFGHMTLEAVDGAITGFRRPDQVDPILAAAFLDLTDEDVATIGGAA